MGETGVGQVVPRGVGGGRWDRPPSGRYGWLRRILELDPERDHQEILRISSGFEFPWDYRKALEFALFRTYCVPSVSALLDATGEFARRPQKRYDDTALLMAELVEHGYDSERGRQALRVVNRMHGRYVISDDDMRYVLSTFVYEPVRWLERFGWRSLTGHERLAAYHFYREVGHRMGIRDIPGSYADFERFNVEYEREHFRHSESNRHIGQYTVDLFASWFPRPLRPLARRAVVAALDQPVLDAFGFDPAPAWLRRLVPAALRARSAVVRHLPPRRTSRMAHDRRNRTYPGYPRGYRVSDLGAPEPDGIDPRWLARRR
ncbi:hypothetical protein (DUF2236) [Streptoalloteichus tenebrarius]|uniref:ER-bound oxygenase mpaB/mpaB'/Rubber oxygenase catalytic domain-containing protein n=1 Tax=Streptoalloteichus tenebrarius (strain ATCC 17920 / DSM 40477 / JCM 4838 / CBS 697.72 / NBRC 16177 / NCIMB 11028 / NRRL B-12390 / A12253. 1 / ISP 5477) TaxID=1933 RepID=A0ABT1I417_STRSD|nr:oxygenase MpaB family protein [Streptoalloteichus tenebrarius]MCP2262504.1 hypothetical protein (DUF2236) [Streptoalloteichus tenebrarius]BFE99658.1 oxygenase MpaB family protein [Streptoalloteichus tenebrarius]